MQATTAGAEVAAATAKVAAQKPAAVPEKTKADEPKQAAGAAQGEVPPAGTAGAHVGWSLSGGGGAN
jgi:hypothetical protein